MAKVVRNDSNSNSVKKTTVRETVTESAARNRADMLNQGNRTDGVWYTVEK